MDDREHPDGIERRHIHEARGSLLQHWPVGLVGLGILLGASLLGLFGTETQLRASGEGIGLALDAPSRIRNGEFFEMLVSVDLEEPVEDLVLRVGDDVWRDVTINTSIPAASEESHADGAFEFRYGPVEAGSRFVIKIDGQVNPDHTPSANRGTVSVADGDGPPLASVDYVMEVLP